jgi:guanylate kinase
MKGKLVLIIGPSGVGKSVILKELRTRHPEYHFPRSATTRQKRAGEGDDLYRFISDAEFDDLLAQKKILEWAVVHAGSRYGTLADEIIPQIEKGVTVIREVDVQGFLSIQNHPLFAGTKPKYEMLSIFILPESKEQLIDHIQKRAPMEQEELSRRLVSMEKELAYAEHCSASVVNKEGKLDETLKNVEKLIGA